MNMHYPNDDAPDTAPTAEPSQREWLEEAARLIRVVTNAAFACGAHPEDDETSDPVAAYRAVLDRSKAAQNALLAHLAAHPSQHPAAFCAENGNRQPESCAESEIRQPAPPPVGCCLRDSQGTYHSFREIAFLEEAREEADDYKNDLVLLYAAPAVEDAAQEQQPDAEYLARAIPRLAAIDALTPACKWDEMAPDHEAMEARARWKRLMNEQAIDEQEAGL